MKPSSSNPGTIDFFFCGKSEDTKIHQGLIDRLSNLDDQFFPTPWNSQKWNEVLKHKSGSYLIGVCHDVERVYGFALFGTSNPDSAHLYKILVDPELKRQGLGRTLLLDAMSLLKEKKHKSVFLEVEQSNFEALGFYRNLGYKVLVGKKDFYGPMRDAFAMEAIL
ncbi:MAG: hypothetical protein CME70_19980 [Halobacteriovorax sp.]|nr:hypothetical protein [Halobacteriovorax sp.]|tara:strand:- start:61313 stop:61807 length:495 start_codon:yes stop_codon:yes gene_type:complete